MRFFLFLTLILSQTSCTTIEVAKEVTKASQSIKTSVNNIIDSIEGDRKILEVEKEEEKKLILEQKKIAKINFLKKNMKEISLNLGEPGLIREDGNIIMKRYDTKNCRLFLFFNSKEKIKKIEYFEIKDIFGKIIIKKEKVQNCYKELNLS